MDLAFVKHTNEKCFVQVRTIVWDALIMLKKG